MIPTDEFVKALTDYQEHFNDVFPIDLVVDQNKVPEIIKHCIETDTKFPDDYDPNLIY